jgi:hypothetical protein
MKLIMPIPTKIVWPIFSSQSAFLTCFAVAFMAGFLRWLGGRAWVDIMPPKINGSFLATA